MQASRTRSRTPPYSTVHQIFSGTTLTHEFTPPDATTPVTDELTNPDDVTELGHNIFVGFQNGVGATRPRQAPMATFTAPSLS